MTTTTLDLDLALLPHPFVITLGNLKGGVGKTTSAFFLACYFAAQGKRVLMIDADPLSQTGASWHRRLRKAGVVVPFDLVAFPSKQIADCITDHATTHDVIIIDAGGESADIFKAALTETDVLLMIAGENPSEVNRIASTHIAAEEATMRMTKIIEIFVLMAKVEVTMRKGVNVSKEYRKQRGKLEEAGFLVLDNYASDWKWYREAADGDVGDGAENPIENLAEFEAIGNEIVARYAAFLRGEDAELVEQAPAMEPVAREVSA